MGDLNRLHDMRSLDRSEAQAIMNDMISGAMSEVKLSATLASLNHRELQLDEVLGFRDAMIEHCQRVDLGGAACMDFCGTGGDGKDTFNISTTTAFLLGAMGVPVVATAVGGTPELVEDGVNGRLFTPGDVAALSSHVQQYASYAALRNRHGSASRQKIEASFSIEAMVAAYRDTYLDMTVRR